MAEPTTVDHELLTELRKISKQLSEINDVGKKTAKRGDRTLNKLSDLVRVSTAVELGFALALTVGAIAIHKATAPSNAGLNYPDFGQPVQESDKIAGYAVTSGFGMRDHPIHGTQKMHKGVDVATPTGTTLYMIGDRGSVECLSDPDGYGTYAIIKPAIGGSQFEFLAGHLSNCAAGDYVAGQVFATTGNSGGSTGPHLHWEQHENGKPIAPRQAFLQWVLTGEKPIIKSSDTLSQGLDIDPLSSSRVNPGIYAGVRLDNEQVAIASRIIEVGRQEGMNQRDITVALMAALQESSLRNLEHGDDWHFQIMGWGDKSDSLGVFQQRDSWGSKSARLNPEQSARLFYQALKQVPNRSVLPLGDAAQAVQGSAYPRDYDKWEPVAIALLESGVNPVAVPQSFEDCRDAAAKWYSGDAALKNSTASQGGNLSVYEYTKQTCERF